MHVNSPCNASIRRKSLSDSDILGNAGHRQQIKRIDNEVNRVFFRIKDLATALKKESDALAALIRKCGIALLPDEVLTTIFEMVIESAGPEESSKFTSLKWKAAVRFSHIDHRFRSIVLENPNFWTNMNSSLRMATVCLPRTKGLPLSVGVTIYDHRQESGRTFDAILAELLPVMASWGQLR